MSSIETEKIYEMLVDLAERNTSTRADEDLITMLMSSEYMAINGRVTGGIVYIFPYNTQPIDIHTFAKMILKAMDAEGVC